MRPPGVGALLLLIIFATLMFGIGAVMEKAAAPVTTATSPRESPGSEAGSPGEPVAAGGETIAGFNPEATPLVLAAIAGSLVLAGCAWLYWRRRAVLLVIATAMTVFALLDVVEVVHQVFEAHPSLVAVAGLVLLLHLGAAIAAFRLVSKVNEAVRLEAA